MDRSGSGLGSAKKGRRLARLAVAGVLAILASSCRSGPQTGVGDPVNGEALAREWCASCHQVAPGQKAETPEEAPSFMEIAARPGWGRERLLAFMDEDHLPMPTFRLWDIEREDVAAYILRLRRIAALALQADAPRDRAGPIPRPGSRISRSSRRGPD